MEQPPSYANVRQLLERVASDPSTPLDIAAIEKLQAELTASTNPAISAALLTQISQLFPLLQEDPTPLTVLATKATAFINFAQLRSLDPPVSFLAGVKAPSPPINLLALSLLAKAGETPSDAAYIAGNSELVVALVELWLSTTDTAVAQAAFGVLLALLQIDYIKPTAGDSQSPNTKAQSGGQGLVWRRLFGDKDVYELFFATCSLANAGESGQLTMREKTVAQGRLMDFVSRVGHLDWRAVGESQISAVETKYHSNSLVHFAACKMVDTGDVLMHMTLISFLRDLLDIDSPGFGYRGSTVKDALSAFSSPSLDFLISSQLHDRILSYYLDPSALDTIDAMYLSGPVMVYISQYALLYPNHFLQNPQALLDKILSHIFQSFDIPSAQWAHGAAPTGDLAILASIPRVLLVEASNRSMNPLLAIPSNPLTKETLDTLATIFSGPKDIKFAPSSQQDKSAPTSPRKEAAAARILYLLYINEKPDFWTRVVAAADVLALQDVALAAIRLMRLVVTANWEVVSSENSSEAQSRYRLPTETQVSRLGPSADGSLPASGYWALLTPPALTAVLPYLYKPPQTYSNFVGGGGGDTESAVWRAATAKYDVLVALHDALMSSSERMEGFQDIVQALSKRVTEGPWGPSQAVGSRVDALEM